MRRAQLHHGPQRVRMVPAAQTFPRRQDFATEAIRRKIRLRPEEPENETRGKDDEDCRDTERETEGGWRRRFVRADDACC